MAIGTAEIFLVSNILDLMVIGAVLYLLDIFMPEGLVGHTIILRTAGILIFLYG